MHTCMYVQYECMYVCICSISFHLLQTPPLYTESFAKADYGTESGVIAWWI